MGLQGRRNHSLSVYVESELHLRSPLSFLLPPFLAVQPSTGHFPSRSLFAWQENASNKAQASKRLMS